MKIQLNWKGDRLLFSDYKKDITDAEGSKRVDGSSGHIWQGRFKSFIIQRDEHLLKEGERMVEFEGVNVFLLACEHLSLFVFARLIAYVKSQDLTPDNNF